MNWMRLMIKETSKCSKRCCLKCRLRSQKDKEKAVFLESMKVQLKSREQQGK